MTTIEIGNIGSEEKAKKIYNALNGKTYMNFIVDWGAMGGNYPVNVSTNESITEDELKQMVLFLLASSL
jgi:hypothetical protein